MDIWEYIGGSMRIIMGACVSLWVGTAFFVALNFSSELNDLDRQTTQYSIIFNFSTVMIVTPVTILVLGKFIAVPMLFIIGWSEITERKDATFYMLSGVAMGILLIGYGVSRDLPFSADLHQWLIIICSCIIGVLAYWLITGKSAGRFKLRRQDYPDRQA